MESYSSKDPNFSSSSDKKHIKSICLSLQKDELEASQEAVDKWNSRGGLMGIKEEAMLLVLEKLEKNHVNKEINDYSPF